MEGSDMCALRGGAKWKKEICVRLVGCKMEGRDLCALSGVQNGRKIYGNTFIIIIIIIIVVVAEGTSQSAR